MVLPHNRLSNPISRQRICLLVDGLADSGNWRNVQSHIQQAQLLETTQVHETVP
jgi:hypothetical protein